MSENPWSRPAVYQGLQNKMSTVQTKLMSANVNCCTIWGHSEGWLKYWQRFASRCPESSRERKREGQDEAGLEEPWYKIPLSQAISTIWLFWMIFIMDLWNSCWPHTAVSVGCPSVSTASFSQCCIQFLTGHKPTQSKDYVLHLPCHQMSCG